MSYEVIVKNKQYHIPGEKKAAITLPTTINDVELTAIVIGPLAIHKTLVWLKGGEAVGPTTKRDYSISIAATGHYLKKGMSLKYAKLLAAQIMQNIDMSRPIEELSNDKALFALVNKGGA